MRRVAFLLLLAAAAPAQVGSQLDSLAATAARASANWETLATGLDAKIARMLPCDPRLTQAIQDVSQASQARLAARNQYLQAALAESGQDTETARLAVQAGQTAARELETDRAEADEERIAVEGQLSDLSDSVKLRPALGDARTQLQAIAAKIAARSTAIQSQIARRAALLTALNNLYQARQARQRALQAQLSALSLETLRWTDYYAVRLARARTECDIINPNPPARRKQ